MLYGLWVTSRKVSHLVGLGGKISFELWSLKHQLPELPGRDPLPISFLASKQTPMGLCYERQHLCFEKEISDGFTCWDMGVGPSSAVWNDVQCWSALMQSPSMSLWLVLSWSLFLFPVPSSFPTTIHRSPWSAFRALYAKRSWNRKFKGNTTLVGRMFTCYLKSYSYTCSVQQHFKQEILIWLLVVHLISWRMTAYDEFIKYLY